jgi:serine/tyrosine/threonine adenylyltransferase
MTQQLNKSLAHPLESLAWRNAWLELPEVLRTPQAAEPLAEPNLLHVSPQAAALLGLQSSDFKHRQIAAWFSGSELLPNASPPLATVYSGHQFGYYVSQLGDGRALWLGELLNAQNEAWELQLKGAGRTPYSRQGDGRAVLRSSIREYLCSEAMAALGVPTTRALCLVSSPEAVYRETVETAAVVTRMAPSFLRFGHVQFLAHTQRHKELQALLDWTITYHYPHLAALPPKEAYTALLLEVTERTARLMSHWQAVGFCHGVMNTDNMSLLGLTLDYGPFGFMEAFDPAHICNHSDHEGRYSYRNQPPIGLWNLHQLAQAFAPLLPELSLEVVTERYQAVFQQSFMQQYRSKLGLYAALPEDGALLKALFGWMATYGVDYTRFFRALSKLQEASQLEDFLKALGLAASVNTDWFTGYFLRLNAPEEKALAPSSEERQIVLLLKNPKFVLRNYMAQQAIEACQKGNNIVLERLFTVLSAPFEEHPQEEAWAAAPPAWACQLSVSCSS